MQFWLYPRSSNDRHVGVGCDTYLQSVARRAGQSLKATPERRQIPLPPPPRASVNVILTFSNFLNRYSNRAKFPSADNENHHWYRNSQHIYLYRCIIR